MMKKMLSIIMAMLLLWSFTVAAHAENEFVLRNGIQFGDTKEEVRAKETIEINEEEGNENQIWTKEGNVAGFEGVNLLYVFDDEDKLIEVKWQLPESSYSDTSDSIYSKMKKALSEKYGTPLGYTNGDFYIITTTAVTGAAVFAGTYKLVGKYGDLRDYDEWDYEYQNGQHVKIDLIQFYTGATYNSLQYRVWIGYKHFTDEELNADKQEKEEQNAAVLNDI